MDPFVPVLAPAVRRQGCAPWQAGQRQQRADSGEDNAPGIVQDRTAVPPRPARIRTFRPCFRPCRPGCGPCLHPGCDWPCCPARSCCPGRHAACRPWPNCRGNRPDGHRPVHRGARLHGGLPDGGDLPDDPRRADAVRGLAGPRRRGVTPGPVIVHRLVPVHPQRHGRRAEDGSSK